MTATCPRDHELTRELLLCDKCAPDSAALRIAGQCYRCGSAGAQCLTTLEKVPTEVPAHVELGGLCRDHWNDDTNEVLKKIALLEQVVSARNERVGLLYRKENITPRRASLVESSPLKDLYKKRSPVVFNTEAEVL